MTALFSLEHDGDTMRIAGRVTVEAAEELRAAVASLRQTNRLLTLDFTESRGMQTTAAAIIYRMVRDAEQRRLGISLHGLSAEDEGLFASFRHHETAAMQRARGWSVERHFEGVGDDVVNAFKTVRGLWRFANDTFGAFLNAWSLPAKFRWGLTMFYMEETGVRAVPIIGVLCWLIGTVLGFQAGYQLKTFAAEMFMPDLLAYSITWEIGPLIAAVLVAGRSSSAFAAEIGTMKVRQEVDALGVMGFNIYEYLVTPKMVALIIVMPLLVLLADFFGLLGGLLIGGWYLDMPARYYISRLHFVMLPMDIWWGMLKGVLFGVIIANVGCYMGMKVRGGAAEVGKATTAAVVTAIFLVIVADAITSLIFVQIRPTVRL